MRGLFLTFEGADGCGKSTQIRFLSEYLRDLGMEPLLTREPGGTPISEQLRSILLDNENTEMASSTEVLLYAAARAQHVKEVIRPAVEAGRIVISDRFIDSSLAYQGFGRRLGIEEVLNINQYAIQGMMPDRTFFLDFPPELSFSRMHKRTSHDRLEEQDDDFYRRLYEGYKALCDMYPNRIIRIDASGNKFQTRDQIRVQMDLILAQRG